MRKDSSPSLILVARLAGAEGASGGTGGRGGKGGSGGSGDKSGSGAECDSSVTAAVVVFGWRAWGNGGGNRGRGDAFGGSSVSRNACYKCDPISAARRVLE